MTAHLVPAQPVGDVGWAARRLAADLPDGSVINLGIGLPGTVATHLDVDREIVVQSENGIVGVGAPPSAGQEDWDLIDPGKSPVTLVTGGAFIDHVESFTVIRGGHLDVAVLGAFEVSVHGDLANWTSGGMPAVGGAMDLAAGARQVWVLMRARGPRGDLKLVHRCALPVTARGVVDRIYTDLGVLTPTNDSFQVEHLAPGVSATDLQTLLEQVTAGH